MLKKSYRVIINWIRFMYLFLKCRIMRSLFRLLYLRKRKEGGSKRILTFCMGGLGDVVLATPFYESLRNARPDCKIDVIVPMVAAELMEKNFPVINSVIRYPVNSRYMNMFLAWRFFRDLYTEHYDSYFCVVDYTYPYRPPHNLYGSIIGYVADVPERVGIYRQNNAGFIPLEEKLITYVFKKRTLFTRYGFWDRNAHMVHEHLKLLNLIGIEPSTQKLSLYSDPVSDCEIDHHLAGFAGQDDLLVLLAPTSTMRYKQWHFKRYAELADRLVADFGARIVIAGAKEDKVGELIRILMNNECMNFSGTNALSLPQYVSLAKRSQICIGLDSGATHIALALSTPTIMIFGATPAGLAKPLDERRNRIIEPPGRACGSYCNGKQCHETAPCIDLITVDTVYDAFVSILSQEYPERIAA